MTTPAVRREAATHLGQFHDVSHRRACQALGRTAARCTTAAGGRMKPSSAPGCGRSPPVGRRFRYRWLHILLKREGIELNHKKLHRIDAEGRPRVRRRDGRKRALGARARPWPCRKVRTSAGRKVAQAKYWEYPPAFLLGIFFTQLRSKTFKISLHLYWNV